MGKAQSQAEVPDDAAGAAKSNPADDAAGSAKPSPVAGNIAKCYKRVKLITGVVQTYFSKQDRPLKGATLLSNRVELTDPIEVACAVISSWVYTHGQKLACIEGQGPHGIALYWLLPRGGEVDWESPDGLIQDGTACPLIDEGTSEDTKTKKLVSWVKLRYLGRAVYVKQEDVMIRDRPSADYTEARKELRRLFMERGLTAIEGDSTTDGINLDIQDATFLSAGALANSCAAVKIVAKIKGQIEKYEVIVWQGTDFAQRPMDVVTDLSATAISSSLWHKKYPELKVHSGMAGRIQSDKLDYKDLMLKSMKEFFGEDHGTVVFTGHSLGGGCALVAHMAGLSDKTLIDEFKNVEIRSVVFAAPSPFYMHAHAQPQKEGEESSGPKVTDFRKGCLVRLKEACPTRGITNDHVGIVQSIDQTEVCAVFHCGLVEWKGQLNELADGYEETKKMKALKKEFRRTSINYVCDKDVVPRLPTHIDWVRPMLKPVIRDTIFGDKKPTEAVIEWFNSAAEGLLDSFTDMGAWKNTQGALRNYFHMSTIRYYGFRSGDWELEPGIEVSDLNSGITLPQHEEGDDLTYLGSCHSFFPGSIRFVGKKDNWFELNEEELTAKAHKLLNVTKNMGTARDADHKDWEEIYDTLRLWPDTMKRPEPRRWSLLHQAIYWGNKQMVVDLLDEFRADIREPALGENGKELTVLEVVQESIRERELDNPQSDHACQDKEQMLELEKYLQEKLKPVSSRNLV